MGVNDQVAQALLNGETATALRVVNDDQRPEHWLIVLEWGWGETVLAICDYAHHVRGVALAVGAALDVDVDWSRDLDAVLAADEGGEG